MGKQLDRVFTDVEQRLAEWAGLPEWATPLRPEYSKALFPSSNGRKKEYDQLLWDAAWSVSKVLEFHHKGGRG